MNEHTVDTSGNTSPETTLPPAQPHTTSGAYANRWKAWMQQLKEFYIECLRVLKITKKPTMFEFKTIVKVSGLGMAIIGVLGFLIFMLNRMLFG